MATVVKVRSRRHLRILVTSALALMFVLVLALAFAFRSVTSRYVPGEQIEGLTESLAREIPSDYPGVTFDDASSKAGITVKHFHGTRSSQLPEDTGSGAAWGDFDRDGYPDLFLANQAGPLTMTAREIDSSPAQCVLYRNRRDGTFENVTDSTGLGGLRGQFMGAAWGDYDNDGYRDLFVTAYGENRLFRNMGGIGFADVTRKARIGGVRGFWTGASWGDYDRDGNLDLYVCGYVQYHSPRPDEAGATSKQFESDVPFTLNPSSYPPERNLLYRNNGDGTFSETAKMAGVDNPDGRSLSAAWCDFDRDGWPDLYVNNDVSMHAFYRNRGSGRFEDIGTTSWACDYRGGMGIAVGDWDNNQDIDFFLTHWIAQENGLYHNLRARDAKKKNAQKQLHFIDISDQVGLGQSSLDYVGWGTSFLDFDNDGRLDLAIANGSTFEERNDRTKLVAMRNQLYWNAGQQTGYLESGGSDRGFFQVEDAAGDALKAPNVGRGLAVADYDRDGAVDILITRNGGVPLLARNTAKSLNKWIGFRLEGAKSSRDAIGAVISVKAGGKKQLRVVGASSSYLSQDDLVQTFGLGSLDRVESAEVVWPSGLRQTIQSVEAGAIYAIKEGSPPARLTSGKEDAR